MEQPSNIVELARIVENSLRELNSAMGRTEALSIRIGRRTTQVIRFSLAGLLSLGLIMTYLLYVLTSDMGDMRTRMRQMSTHMEGMRANFETVALDMGHMKRCVASIDGHIAVMPTMSQYVLHMSRDMSSIHEAIAGMRSDFALMTDGVTRIGVDVHGLNGQLTGLNQSVYGMGQSIFAMGHDMSKMAKPMTIFPMP